LPPDLLNRVIDVLRDVTEQLPPSSVERSAERP
jgi:hypothetical protein